MEPLTPEQVAFARRQVGRWMRLKGEHEQRGTDELRMWLRGQGAADADHSALLWRLLEGKEPLPEPPPLEHAYPVYPD
jgi:hypothetical protein